MNKHLEGINLDAMISNVTEKLKDSPLQPSIQTHNKSKDILQHNQIDQLKINEETDNLNEIQKKKSIYDEVFSLSHENYGNELISSIKKTSSLTPAELKKANEIKRTDSFQKDEYLQPIDWDYIDSENFFCIENQFNTLAESINKTNLYQLCTSIQNCNMDKSGSNPTIGPSSSLQFLIESQFLYDMNQIELMILHMSQLDNLVFKWRNIKGDGNCFYRAIIFSLMENIILSKNLLLMKEIIIDLNERLNDMKEFNVFPSLKDEIDKLNINLIIQILYLITEAMDNDQPDLKPLEILVKCFLFCCKFDIGMIFYLRCLLYDYIKRNKNKIYSTDFSVKIGNLLPSEYETENGEFLFDKFFEEDLLKMGTDGEKIVIYLTPLALRCDINVIIYEFDMKDAVTKMSFPSYLINKPKINVLYRKTHYDLIYSQKYYSDNLKAVDYYVNVNENQQQQFMQSSIQSTTQQSIKQSQSQCSHQANQSKIIQQSYNKTTTHQYLITEETCSTCKATYSIQQTTFSLCSNCLKEELSNLIFTSYLQYLFQVKQMNNNTRCNYREIFDKYFREINCLVNNKQILLIKAIEIAKINLLVIIKEMKTKLCVQCQNIIKSSNDIWFDLPCDCLLCSKECFSAYFDDLMVKDLEYCKDKKIQCHIFNSCLCGYQFNNNDYAKLYLQFEKNDMKKLNKTLKKVILNNLQQNCMKCLCLRKMDKGDIIYQAILKDEKITQTYKEKEFFHIICNECHASVGKAKKIECCLCNSRHTISKFKQLTGKDEDECIIF